MCAFCLQQSFYRQIAGILHTPEPETIAQRFGMFASIDVCWTEPNTLCIHSIRCDVIDKSSFTYSFYAIEQFMRATRSFQFEFIQMECSKSVRIPRSIRGTRLSDAIINLVWVKVDTLQVTDTRCAISPGLAGSP